MGIEETNHKNTCDKNQIPPKSVRSKILVLCPDLPYPIYAGGHMRMASILEAMTRFASVHVACVAAQVPKITRVWCSNLNITMDWVPPFQSTPFQVLKDRFYMLWDRDNFIYRRDFQLFFDQIFGKVEPNLVWLETPYLIRYALQWKKRAPLVVDFWGTSEGAARILARAAGYHKIKAGLQWWIARGGERILSSG